MNRSQVLLRNTIVYIMNSSDITKRDVCFELKIEEISFRDDTPGLTAALASGTKIPAVLSKLLSISGVTAKLRQQGTPTLRHFQLHY